MSLIETVLQKESEVEEKPLEELVAEGQALTEELAVLNKQVKELTKRLDEVKAGIIDSLPGLAPTESVTVESEGTTLEIGPKGNKVTDVDRVKARKLLGDELYDSLAAPSIGNIRKHLNPLQQQQVLTEKAEGNRKFSWSKK